MKIGEYKKRKGIKNGCTMFIHCGTLFFNKHYNYYFGNSKGET